VNGEKQERARRLRNVEMAKASAASEARLAPLRRIERTELVDGQLVDTLECGHRHKARTGLFGPQKAKRRRCLQCLEELRKESS
jgi:hypothetical protein